MDADRTQAAGLLVHGGGPMIFAVFLLVIVPAVAIAVLVLLIRSASKHEDGGRDGRDWYIFPGVSTMKSG